jgi:hypothetical protein
MEVNVYTLFRSVVACTAAILLAGPSHAQSREKLEEQLERGCFQHGRKGWALASIAGQDGSKEPEVKSLARELFDPSVLPQIEEPLNQLVSGRFKSPEEFAVVLNDRCLDTAGAHVVATQSSSAQKRECFQQLTLPQYVYEKKYAHNEPAASLMAEIPSTWPQVRQDFVRKLITDMYSSSHPEDNDMVFWFVFKSCLNTRG